MNHEKFYKSLNLYIFTIIKSSKCEYNFQGTSLIDFIKNILFNCNQLTENLKHSELRKNEYIKLLIYEKEKTRNFSILKIDIR